MLGETHRRERDHREQTCSSKYSHPGVKTEGCPDCSPLDDAQRSLRYSLAATMAKSRLAILATIKARQFDGPGGRRRCPEQHSATLLRRQTSYIVDVRV